METIDFFKPAGTMPSDREWLMSLVNEGRRISKHSLTEKLGHGSNKENFVNLGKSGAAGRVKEWKRVPDLTYFIRGKKCTKR